MRRNHWELGVATFTVYIPVDGSVHCLLNLAGVLYGIEKSWKPGSRPAARHENNGRDETRPELSVKGRYENENFQNFI